MTVWVKLGNQIHLSLDFCASSIFWYQQFTLQICTWPRQRANEKQSHKAIDTQGPRFDTHAGGQVDSKYSS